MEKTLIIWRRLGKEHGENQGYRINPPEEVEEHLRSSAETLRQTPEDEWRWWQVNDDLLVERRDPTRPPGPDNTFFYLPKRGWVIHNPWHPSLAGKWQWYVHIGDIQFEDKYDCWVFTDLFTDALVKEDNVTHSILDLDDLAAALEIGLVTAEQGSRILQATQELVTFIRDGGFPPEELLKLDNVGEMMLCKNGKSR